MIARLMALLAAGAGAYALLKGWPEGWPALVRACVAVLVLVCGIACWAARRHADGIPLAKGARKAGWVDFIAIGMGMLALESGFLWMLSVAPKPLENVAILIEEKLQPEAAAQRAESKTQAVGTGNWLWSEEGRRSLPRRTNLKPGAKPEVFVRLVKEEDADRLLKRQVYVRAFVLDQFQEGIWSLRRGVEKAVEADDDGWIRFGKNADEKEIFHEVFHGKDAGGRDVLTSLQGARAVRLPSLRIAADGMAFLPDVSGPTGFEYLASSAPVTLEDMAGVEVAGTTEGGNEGLSEGGGRRIGELAMKAAGTGTIVERLLNIQNFLRDEYGYSLVTENRKNLDPLENFLFEEKRGHCEFFATAGALMARELGVESRVAYGWAGGQYFEESRMFVFRAREAHSWVEVKLNGRWVVMEPTPPVVLGGGNGTPKVADAGEAMPGPNENLNEDANPERAGNGHAEKIALILTGVFAGVAGVMLLLRRRRGWARNARALFPVGEKTRGYLALWRKACAKRGIRVAGGKTLKSQIGAMEKLPDFAEELKNYHYGVMYEQNLPDTSKEKGLEKKISDWGES